MGEEAFKGSNRFSKKLVKREGIRKVISKNKNQKKEDTESPLTNFGIKHFSERSNILSDYEQEISVLSGFIASKSFINTMLEDKISFKEALLKTKDAEVIFTSGNQQILDLVDSISESFEHIQIETRKNSRYKNLGVDSKNNADIFAETMGDNLQKVRNEGHTTMRSIADRFNELGIKSARGYDWSHTTVNQLIKRRKNLGLESDGNDAGLDMD